MKDLDKDDSCRKKCHKIMKKFRDEIWCREDEKKELTSYVLKNVLFWECEKYPNDQQWSQDKLNRRVTRMTESLLFFLENRCLPLYFNENVNLLETKNVKVLAKIARKINLFLENPTHYF